MGVNNVVRRTKEIQSHRGRTTPCAYWLAGRCNRNPCKFLHTSPPHTTYHYANNPYTYTRKPHSSSHSNSKTALTKNNRDETKPNHKSSLPNPSICKYWVNDNCTYGQKCRNLHSWFLGDRLSSLTKLQDHKKVITGIALPVGSDKLYSGSTDGTVRIWDYHTGVCTNVINFGVKITSLIREGSWVFVGILNAIKACNIQTLSEFTLDGPKGQVLSMIVGNDTLFAAAEDGVIYAWRDNSESSVELVARLTGHSKAVVCLTVGRKRLYSGSMDQSIKVWNIYTFECEMTLNGHTDVVTSLICWDHHLLSSSLDCTIKVWSATGEKTLQDIYMLEETYTHTLENGVVALSGMTDAEANHILFCSCKDNSVRLYELPSFLERGRLFSKKEVASFELGPDGLFFTGDGTGLLTVWKWLDVKVASVQHLA
ncbi:zinc finger CCCH domain-containing protein 17 [Cajanus cajan]|uniref:zinc finger CCCH domain-containing protein 17 n=1 Tax=Cajanus cajan TaxID=3821 RepID=UPI00098DA2B0|nr:zinc finger CCCH domain-containing protein 17 [Cajanus cajan]